MQLLNFFDPSKEFALDELATKMSLPDSDRNSEIYQVGGFRHTVVSLVLTQGFEIIAHFKSVNANQASE